MNPENFICGWEISENYTNGSIYVDYIENRDILIHIKYDIIDRHGAHKAKKANVDRGDFPVLEVYN